MKKTELYATIGTIVICGILLAILLLCGLTIQKEQLEEGLMVSFGDDITGYGEPAPQTPTVAAVAPAVIPKETVQEKLMTQDEPSVALEQEKKRKKEQEQQRQQQLIEQQRQQEQREAEQRKRDAQSAKAASAGKVFSNTPSKGSGDGEGDKMQGNPAGRGNSGGHSWSLDGRDILGSIAEPPYEGKQEGRVVVNIKVDENGTVTSASIKERGTTISDEALRNACKTAALKVKFSTARNSVHALGEITFRFTLN